MQVDSKENPDSEKPESKKLWVDPALTIIPRQAVQSGPTDGPEDSDIMPQDS